MKMQLQTSSLSKAYSTQSNETTLSNPKVIGDIPKWLLGSFVSNGPAQFEIETTQFKHWLDGFAMLKIFNFKDGNVCFQNHFLQSRQYVGSHSANRLYHNEFATYADTSWIDRMQHSIEGLLKGTVYDNCNVNTTRIADHYIAMTESREMIEFKLSELSTIGSFQFADRIFGQLGTAHPFLDVITGESINVAIEIGQVIKYHVYKITPNSIKREIIKTYLSDKPFYMHSFSITPHYIVLFKSPLIINKFKLLLGLPFNNTLSWKKNRSSFFIVIDRRDGTTHEIETDPFVCLHSANASESGTELILDLICYGEGNPYDALYLSNLKSARPHLPSGVLKRYTIDVPSKRCNYQTLSTNNQEFPRINDRKMNNKNYQFIYTNSIIKNHNFFNAIQKCNVHTGKIQCWEKANYYPGEAIFVATPNNQSEDEGALLSIAFNAATQCSSLVILDAYNMQQMAEVPLPFHLPFGLHGNFYYPSIDAK